jgi:hypothetical protein
MMGIEPWITHLVNSGSTTEPLQRHDGSVVKLDNPGQVEQGTIPATSSVPT